MNLRRMVPVLFVVVLLAPALAIARDTTPPAITPEPVSAPEPGQPVVITAKVLDPSGIFEPTVYWRGAGGGDFQPASMAKAAAPDTYLATFLPPAGTTAVEYYLEAYDNEGNGPARVGAPEAPLTLALGAAVAAAAPAEVTAAPEKPAEPAAATVEPPSPSPSATSRDVPAEASASTSLPTPPRTTDSPDLAHTIDIPLPGPAWKRPTVIGLAAAGVVLVVTGVFMLSGARADATAFNTAFNARGTFSDDASRSISTREGVAVTLLTGGVLLGGAGAGLFVVRF